MSRYAGTMEERDAIRKEVIGARNIENRTHRTKGLRRRDRRKRALDARVDELIEARWWEGPWRQEMRARDAAEKRRSAGYVIDARFTDFRRPADYAFAEHAPKERVLRRCQ